MITFKKAQKIIQCNVQETNKSELIFTENAHMRILNKDYLSKSDIPRDNLSSMDGIVVFKNEKNRKLKIIGETKAGDKKGKQFKYGECSLIFTGGPIFGNDKIIIPKENFEIKQDHIQIKTLPFQNFIRKKASDLKRNKTYLKKKTLLNIRSIVLAKSMRLKKVNVLKKPRIFVICTGDEIISNNKKRGLVESTNHIFIKYFTELLGGEVKMISYAEDSYDDFVKIYKSFLDFDLLITSGGISRGKYDIVKRCLKDCGLNILFDKVSIKPGKPTTFGKFNNNKYFLGLPGNPVSCFMSLINFLPIFMDAFLGLKSYKLIFTKLASNKFINENKKLTHFQRVKVKKNYFNVFKDQDSSLMSILNSADGILIREPNSPPIKKQQKVNILLFKDIFKFGI